MRMNNRNKVLALALLLAAVGVAAAPFYTSFTLKGSTSGTLQIKPAAIAGTGSVLTLPGGTTDLSAGFGTGVPAALAVSVGSAGAPVILNGALGTPSSGTLTNATGLPISTGVSGLGTGVATAAGNATNFLGGLAAVQYPPGPLSSGLRQIATASGVPTYQDSSVAGFICRTAHSAGDDIFDLSIVTANYWINTSGYAEAGSGSTVSIASWLEWPRGTFTQTTYSSAATGSITSGNQMASDLLTLTATIPHGSQFWVWQRVITTSGTGRVLAVNGTVASFFQGGEGCSFSASGTTTPANVGSLGNINSTTGFRPAALIGHTTRKSMLVLGDSRNAYGNCDQRDSGYPDVGIVNRGLGYNTPYPTPYISVGNSGESLAALIAVGSGGRTNTVALGAYTSDIVNQLGVNDLIGSVSVATIQGYYSTIKGYFSGGQSQWLVTVPPVTTSSDNWATTTNQTTVASNANRVTLNGWMRGTPSGYQGFFEVADATESGYNSGLWAVNGNAYGYTCDGTHSSPLGYDTIRNNKLLAN